MVIDVLMAYGRTNIDLLKKLLTFILELEPKYLDDLKIALNHFKMAFHTVQEQIDKNQENTDFDGLAVYTMDCAATLGILLDVCPKSIEYCFDIQLEQSITNFYDATMPQLYKQIYQINPSANSLKILNQSRMELLGSFRCMSNMYLERILSNP